MNTNKTRDERDLSADSLESDEDGDRRYLETLTDLMDHMNRGAYERALNRRPGSPPSDQHAR